MGSSSSTFRWARKRRASFISTTTASAAWFSPPRRSRSTRRAGCPGRDPSAGPAFMTQLLDPRWWVSLAGDVWPWWLCCAVMGLVAWQLSARLLRGLADAGAGLSIGIGVIATTWTAWMLAHPFTGKAILVRLVFVALGVL